MTDEKNERVKFEACISGPPYELDVRRWPDNGKSAWPGNYRDYKVDLAWALWREGRASLRSELAAAPAVAWQWRRKPNAWNQACTFMHEVFATTDDSEVRALIVRPSIDTAPGGRE